MTTKKYVPEPTDPKEVMAALIHAKKVREAEEKLDQMLIDGLESGPPIPMEKIDWEGFKQIAYAAAVKKAGQR
jgi:hypothetical protein